MWATVCPRTVPGALRVGLLIFNQHTQAQASFRSFHGQEENRQGVVRFWSKATVKSGKGGNSPSKMALAKMLKIDQVSEVGKKPKTDSKRSAKKKSASVSRTRRRGFRAGGLPITSSRM